MVLVLMVLVLKLRMVVTICRAALTVPCLMRGSSVGLRPWGLTQWSPVRVTLGPLEVYPAVNFRAPWEYSRCAQAGPYFYSYKKREKKLIQFSPGRCSISEVV